MYNYNNNLNNISSFVDFAVYVYIVKNIGKNFESISGLTVPLG